MKSTLNRSLWRRWADFTTCCSRSILVTILCLTLFFLVCLSSLEQGTHVKQFHSDDSRDLIDVIEEKFDEGRYASLIFEAQNKRSLFEPTLLKQQFRALQAIRGNYSVTIDSIVLGIDAGLKRVKKITLLEVDDYTSIAEAILSVAGGRTVYDLERVSRHLTSNPDIVDFYSQFRVLTTIYPGAQQGGAQRTYGTPNLKAIKSYLQLDPTLDDKEQKKTLVAIRDLVRSYETDDLKIYMYAEDLVSYDVDLHAQRSTVYMALILIVFDALLLWAVFRTRREVFISFFLMMTALIWTFGIAGLCQLEISFLHLITIPILLGTGVDDIVVFGRRLAEERKKKIQLKEAIRETYVTTGNSILLTTLTTFVAFLCGALISDTEGIASFFFLISISMAVVFFLTVLLEGSLRTELDRRGLHEKRDEAWIPPIVDRLLTQLSTIASRWIAQFPGPLLRYGALLFLLAVAIGVRVDSEYEPKVFLQKDMPTYVGNNKDDTYFGRSDVGYVLIEGNIEDGDLLQKIRDFIRAMGRYPLVEKILNKANVESVHELMDKRGIRIVSNMPVRKTFDRIAANEQIANYPINETYRESARHLMHKTGDRYDALLMKFFVTGAVDDEVEELMQGLQREAERLNLDEMGVRIRIGGGEISTDIEQAIYFDNMVESFFICLGINFLVLMLFWRRWSYALVALVPLILSTAATLAIMVLFGVKLNSLNLTLGVIVVGLGIDYPIHIIERFNEERNCVVGQSSLQAAQKVLSTMGSYIFGASLTTIVGFSAAMVLGMPLAKSFGALVAVAIFLTYLASIFVLPVILVKLGRR